MKRFSKGLGLVQNRMFCILTCVAAGKESCRADSALGAGVLTLVARRCALSVMGRGFP